MYFPKQNVSSFCSNCCCVRILDPRLFMLVCQFSSACWTIHSVCQPKVKIILIIANNVCNFMYITCLYFISPNTLIVFQQVVFDVEWLRQDITSVHVERFCNGAHLLLLPNPHHSSLLQQDMGARRHRGLVQAGIYLVTQTTDCILVMMQLFYFRDWCSVFLLLFLGTSW